MRLSRIKKLAEAGDFLVAWLGDPESDWGYGPDSQQQATDLVLALVALRERVIKGTSVAQAEQEIAAINEMLERYPYVLRLGQVSRGGAFSFYERISPGGLIEIIFRLARAGVLDRLRKCARCSEWFFARTPKGVFCKNSCRQAAFRAKPESVEENKNYQSKYFREQLSVNKKYYREGLSPAEVREVLKKRRQEKRHAKRR